MTYLSPYPLIIQKDYQSYRLQGGTWNPVGSLQNLETSNSVGSRTLSPPGTPSYRGVIIRKGYARYVNTYQISDRGRIDISPPFGNRERYSHGTRLVAFREVDAEDAVRQTSGSLAYPIIQSLTARTNISVRNRFKTFETNAGETLGEADSTINHLAKTAATLGKAVFRAVKGDWSGVARELGVSRRRFRTGAPISERWLEYQYGWRPLMSDIYAIHADLKRSFETKDFVLSAKAYASEDWEYPVNRIAGNNIPGAGDGIQRYQSSVGVHVECVAKIHDAWLYRLAQLNMINPAAVLWYRVPFSFVFDWFIPVSAFLEACSATAGLTFLTGSRSVRTTTRCDYAFRTWRTGETVRDYVPPKGHRAAIRLVRTQLTSFPTPSLYVTRDPFNLNRSANAVALVHQVALGLPK